MHRTSLPASTARRILRAVLVLAPLSLAPVASAHAQHADTTALRHVLDSLADAHHGTVGYSVIDLDDGDRISRRGDETFPTASLIKVSVTRLTREGPAAALGAWETYGFVVAGVASVILIQAALHAGTLVAAQPGITLLDPLVALLWGTIVLGETTRTGPILLLAALGALGIVVGVLLLVRSSTARLAAVVEVEPVH